MRIASRLVLLVIMVGVIGHSVSIPSNSRFIEENPTRAKNSENTNASRLFYTKLVTTNPQSKDAPQFVNENDQGGRSVAKVGGRDDLKRLQPTRRKRNKIESNHARRSLSSPNGKMHLKRTEYNTVGSSHGVKTRIRRTVPIHDTDSNEDNDDDYEEWWRGAYGVGSTSTTTTSIKYEDKDYIDDYEEWWHGAHGVVGSTSTTTTTIKYEDKDYIDDYEEWWHGAHGVVDRTITNRAAVRKCCPNGETFIESRDLCSRSDHPLIRHFHAKSTTGKRLKYIDNSPCPFGGFRLLPHKDKYSVSDDGFLSFGNRNLSSEKFCFEAFLDKEKIYPLVCYKEVSSVYVHIIIGKAITIPFLLITLFIYMFIAEVYNAFRIAVLCHIVTLLCAYIVFLIVEHVNPHMSLNTCRSFAFVIFIMFQTSVFWLNVMCYDLCWIVSMLKTLSRKIKVLLYSCYAWGMPLILMLIFLHRGIVPGIPGHHLKPEYGEGGCRYSAQLDHFYPPVIVLEVCNVILFTITFFKMLCNNRGKLEAHRQQLVQNKLHYNMYILNFKIFLVEGMVTMPFIIMWILDARIIMWYLFNIQEIFICISLVFNDNIMNSIEEQKYTINHEFGNSLRQKHQERYSVQNMEENPNTYLSPIRNDIKNRPSDLKMKTLDANNQANIQ